MLSSLQHSTRTGEKGLLGQVIKPRKVDLGMCHLVPPLEPLALSAHKSFADISNTLHRSPSASLTTATFVGDLLLSRSYPTVHFGRVVSVDRHDTDAWTHERNVHDAEPHAAAVLSSLGLNSLSPNHYFPINVANTFPAKSPRTMEQNYGIDWATEDTAIRRHDWPTSFASPVCTSVTVSPCPLEDLSEGRRRVGKILVRCGVIDCSGAPIESGAVACHPNSCVRHVDDPVVSTVSTDDGHLITALANWTSEWLHTLVIQPHIQGSFRFQYQGKPSRAFASVAPRIFHILYTVENPVQVAIHALWFIGTLTGNCTHDNAPFLSIPIFRYLHNNGTFVAEDFMLRTFVACAMIGDKTVNDVTLSTSTWNRLTRIPPGILNAAEKHTLNCLKWNVVMTRSQWQDTILYLRSCIKMGSAFDPFAYDDSSSSGIIARCLDELIDLCNAGEAGSYLQGAAAAEALVTEVLASQSAQFPTHREDFAAAEWCPNDDPIVNQKPRTIGIAPGADRNSGTLEVGTTANDILESILGSSSVPHLARLAQPAGTSFCGSFGVIGARLAHTIKMAGACQSASWVASHG